MQGRKLVGPTTGDSAVMTQFRAVLVQSGSSADASKGLDRFPHVAGADRTSMPNGFERESLAAWVRLPFSLAHEARATCVFDPPHGPPRLSFHITIIYSPKLP